MREVLVYVEAKWYICTLSVVKMSAKSKLVAVWVERDGAVLCLYGEEIEIHELPEVD